MLTELTWLISFISLYVCIFWFLMIIKHEDKIHEEKKSSYSPKVSIVLPAYNEEHIIGKSIDSLLKMDYPKDKLEVTVVNDGSTDNTRQIVEKYAKISQVKLVNQKNKGKAAALNKGLEVSTGELVGCMDADSIVEKDALRNLVGFFEDKKIGAVITAIYPIKTQGIVERLQKIEYILANLYRKIMSIIGTMYITPGAFSLYRKKLLQKLGGFEEGNLTEDLEIALKLRHNGYDIQNSFNKKSYTEVPSSWREFYNQRIRWYRGLVYNSKKYKDMFLNRKYGTLGMFQIPMNILFPFIAIIAVSILFYNIAKMFFYLGIQVRLTGFELFTWFIELDPIRFFMGLDFKGLFPLIVLLAAAFILIRFAYKHARENMKDVLTLIVFFIFYFTIINIIWCIAIFKELGRRKKQW